MANYTSVSVNSIQLSPEGEVNNIQLSPEGEVNNIQLSPEGEVNNIQLSPEGDVKSIKLSPEGEVNSIQLFPWKGRWIIYNYPPKGSWIVGDILALSTDLKADRGFSIFQISWIKIKKELSLIKDVTLLQLFTFQLTRFWGSFFLWLCCKFRKKFFFYRLVNTKKQNFVYFLGFVGAAASIAAKISPFDTVTKREAILNPVPKQWISKNIPSYGSQSKHPKIAIHWFGEY